MNRYKLILELYNELNSIEQQTLEELIESRLDTILYKYIDELNKSCDNIKGENLIDIMKGVIKIGSNSE